MKNALRLSVLAVIALVSINANAASQSVNATDVSGLQEAAFTVTIEKNVEDALPTPKVISRSVDVAAITLVGGDIQGVTRNVWLSSFFSLGFQKNLSPQFSPLPHDAEEARVTRMDGRRANGRSRRAKRALRARRNCRRFFFGQRLCPHFRRVSVHARAAFSPSWRKGENQKSGFNFWIRKRAV